MSTALLCLMAFSNLVLADTQTEEATVRTLLTERSEAWQNKDVPALMKDYAENADHISSTGEHTAGKKAIEKKYTDLFNSGRFDGTTSKHTVVRVNVVHSNVAVVDAKWETSGFKSDDGTALPNRRGSSILVLIKKDNTWKITTLRAMATPSEEVN